MKKRILILAANPLDTHRLRLDEEIREITNGLERSIYRDEFELRQRLASRPKEFQRAMLDFKPNIVHFCGHGEGEAGIVLENDNGQSHFVDAEALAGLFELFTDQVECVLLNACFSHVQAVAIAKHISYVIGMKQEIGDKAAIEFAVSFYDALGAGKSTEFAFKLACNAIQLAGIQEHLIPSLLTQNVQFQEKRYDVFISCNHSDRDWVKEHVYTPLTQCRTISDKRPRIFFPSMMEAGEPNHNPLDSLEEKLQALQESAHIIPIYTESFFKKEESDWEFKKILQLDPYGKSNIIHPVLADSSIEGSLPFLVSHISYVNAKSSGWFIDLIAKLDLTFLKEKRSAKIVFASQSKNIYVNHTLPPINVEILDENGLFEDFNEEVTIAAENAKLLGTLTKTAQQGRVAFNDLSFESAVASTRLIISAHGVETASSGSFEVKPPAQQSIPPTDTVRKGVITIKHCCKDIILFENNKALVSIGAKHANVFGINGNLLKDQIPIPDRIRVVKRDDKRIVIADWSGNILIIHNDGSYSNHNIQSAKRGLNIPSDIALLQDTVYVAFWNGTIYGLLPDGSFDIEFMHTGGVQRLHITKDHIYICDFEGKLTIVHDGKVIANHPLEESILLLQAFSDSLIVVGENRLHQYAYNRSNVINEESRLTSIFAAISNERYVIVMDPKGKGVRYDKGLIIESNFHTISGAIPLSADVSGKYCIFRYPDDTRVLMVDGRIVYSHPSGLLSITQHGDYIIFSDQDKTKILETEVFLKLYEDSQHG